MTSVFLSLLVVSVPAAPASPLQGVAPKPQGITAGAVFSKALAHYFEAKSVSGDIRLTQTAKGVSAVVNTKLQYDRPSLVYLMQTQGGSQPATFLLASNGKQFSYSKPLQTMGPPRFLENVTQRGYQQTIGDMYAASIRSLLDRSPILDLAIARKEDMKEVTKHFGDMVIKTKVDSPRGPAYVIEGKYFDVVGEMATGTFGATITEDGDILQLRRVQRFRIPDKLNETIEVLSVWDADLKVNAPTDPTLYKG
jgi:hypothetical protein